MYLFKFAGIFFCAFFFPPENYSNWWNCICKKRFLLGEWRLSSNDAFYLHSVSKHAREPNTASTEHPAYVAENYELLRTPRRSLDFAFVSAMAPSRNPGGDAPSSGEFPDFYVRFAVYVLTNGWKNRFSNPSWKPNPDRKRPKSVHFESVLKIKNPHLKEKQTNKQTKQTHRGYILISATRRFHSPAGMGNGRSMAEQRVQRRVTRADTNRDHSPTYAPSWKRKGGKKNIPLCNGFPDSTWVKS